MVEEQIQSRKPAASPARWLFPMMALGGLSASLGSVGKWIGLAIFAPIVAGLWWRERARWKNRRTLRMRAGYEPTHADEFRAGFEGFDLFRGQELLRRVRWDQIRGISAFIDFQTNGDVLTVGLLLENEQGWIGIPADVEGFPLLRLALRDRFGILHGWEIDVWHGPRGLNWLGLWGETLPPGGVCWKCGYNLEGNESGACPECGIPIHWQAVRK